MSKLLKEEANVLYLTILMMMVLVMLTVGLANLILTVMHRTRAQQAADHLALSAAAVKAQYLNYNANINSVITYWLNHDGTDDHPFQSEAEAVVLAEKIKQLHRKMEKQINQGSISGQTLEFLAQTNGLVRPETDFDIGPINIMPEHMQHYTRDAIIQATKPPYRQSIIEMPAHYEPIKNLIVQTRVEWAIHDKIIGKKILPLSSPIIIARSRAEIYDSGQLKSPLGRCWRVKLAPIDQHVDDWLQQQP